MFFETGFANTSLKLDLSKMSFTNVTSSTNMLNGIRTTGKVYVKNANDQNWIITNGGSSNLTTSNVLIK